ncbi:MAG: Bug family tripartite tricarboxylate transporter substrate binding protein [Lautropia sp.]
MTTRRLNRRQLIAAAGAGAATLGLPRAFAQAYPSRPIKIIVPLTAGGPGDVVTRVIAQQMSDVLGRPIVIENIGGANMNIGAEKAAHAEPDGYTLVMNATPMLVNPAMQSRMAYDPVKDFAPISLIASFPLILVANNSLPVSSVRELIAYAKQHPDQLNYGSAGNGSLTHLAGVLLDDMAGVKTVHVPYRGINEAMTDLIGGRVQLSYAGAPIALPNAKSAKVRALASTGAARSAIAPDLPTIAESGLAGYDVTPWYGLAAPKGTPKPIIDRWHTEVVRIMSMPQIKERWLALSADATFSKSPDEFLQLQTAEAAKWAKAVKDSGIPKAS